MLNNDTTLYLLSNIDISEEHQIDFDSETAQSTYFLSKKVLTLINSENNLDFKYIRENNSINVGYYIDELASVNYIMYNNNNKWYYEKITSKEYINPNTTKLTLKLDVYQTFMFDFTLEESFVEREHQDRYALSGTTLTPIYNEEPEGLEIGNDYIKRSGYTREPTNLTTNINGFYLIKSKEKLGDNYYYDHIEGWKPTITNLTENARINTGVYTYIIFSGTYFPNHEKNKISIHNHHTQEVIASYEFSAPPSGLADSSYFEILQENTNIISIQYIRYLDEKLIKFNTDIGFSIDALYGTICKLGNYWGFNLMNYEGKGFTLEYNEELTPTLSIENAPNIINEPKLLTYPYSYLNVCVYGENYQFKREHFYNKGKYVFELHTSLAPQNTLALVPQGYNWDADASNDFYLKFLTSKNELNLRSDKWTDYLLNNKASINGGLAVQGAQFVANMGLGLATGGIGLAVAGSQAINFGASIANTMIQRQDIKQAPDDVRVVSDDIYIKSEIRTVKSSFAIFPFEIRESFKNKLFKYFMHYGYKCNDFKKPNTRSRYYFNYIKTIDANIKSNINRDYIAELGNLFNNGVTIWHYRDATTFKGMRNYDYENVEMALLPTPTE